MVDAERNQAINSEIIKDFVKYYNTLMILNFLLYRKEIQADEYGKYLRRLKKIAHYGKDIYEFGRILYKDIIENDQ